MPSTIRRVADSLNLRVTIAQVQRAIKSYAIGQTREINDDYAIWESLFGRVRKAATNEKEI